MGVLSVPFGLLLLNPRDAAANRVALARGDLLAVPNPADR